MVSCFATQMSDCRGLENEYLGNKDPLHYLSKVLAINKYLVINKYSKQVSTGFVSQLCHLLDVLLWASYPVTSSQ